MQEIEGPITAKAGQVRAEFRALLDKTNKENPHVKDVKALSVGTLARRCKRRLLAELTVIENARATLREFDAS